MSDTPRQLVTISCETTALTTLPDALLDDAAISPMAKMAYWYLKRHGGMAGNGDQICREMATELRSDYECMWRTLAELRDSGWMMIGKNGTEVRLTVHEVPAVKR